MKKFAQIIAVVLLLVTAVATLTACGISGYYEDDKQWLIKHGYTLRYDKYDVELEQGGIIAEKFSCDLDELEHMTVEELRKVYVERITIFYFSNQQTTMDTFYEYREQYKNNDNVKVDWQRHAVVVQEKETLG